MLNLYPKYQEQKNLCELELLKQGLKNKNRALIQSYPLFSVYMAASYRHPEMYPCPQRSIISV